MIMSNIGEKDNLNKPIVTEVDADWILEIAKAMSVNKKENGGKYDRGNHYKDIDPIDLLNSVGRHYLELVSHYQRTGNLDAIDKESNIPHLYLIGCNTMMIHIQIKKNEIRV